MEADFNYMAQIKEPMTWKRSYIIHILSEKYIYITPRSSSVFAIVSLAAILVLNHDP